VSSTLMTSVKKAVALGANEEEAKSFDHALLT
jgi:hypothetical protein